MKKKILALLLAFVLALGLCACGDSGLAVIDDTYEVSSAKGLQKIAKMSNNNKQSFAGKTILLTADIDMSDVEWIPIGQNGNNAFCGTFDGQGHTITNLNVELGDGYYVAGLFGYVNGTVKNLKITDSVIHVHSHGHSAVVLPSSSGVTSAGAVCGIAVMSSVLENITVSGCEIVSGTYAGGIVGTLQGQIIGCSASNNSLSAEEVGDLYVDHSGHSH